MCVLWHVVAAAVAAATARVLRCHTLHGMCALWVQQQQQQKQQQQQRRRYAC